MERYPLDPEKMDITPEGLGDLNAPEKKSKRKRNRKSKRAPLDNLVQKEAPTNTDEQSKTERDALDEQQRKNSETEPQEVVEELILPEIEHPEGIPYEGELLIEHSDTNEVANEGEVDAFEALLDSDEATKDPVDTEPLRDVIAENLEQSHEKSPPPVVAPPLPFFGSVETVPKSEQATAYEVPAVYPIPENQPRSNSLGGRLSEEWASIRRRNQENQPLVTEADAADREYYAEKRGLSKGVISGGLVGYLIGRRGKRSLQREAAASLKNRDKTIEALSKERDLALSHSEEQLSALKRTQNELSEMMRRTKNAIGSNFREITPQIETTRVVEVPSLKSPEQTLKQSKEVHEPFETEQQIATDKHIENRPVAAESILPEDKAVAAETYQTPEGRRVEASAWHRIEIDEKTGRAVENPTLAYGEAFMREQSVEKLAREAAKAQTAAKVGMTLLYSGTEQSKSPLLPKSDPLRRRVVSAAKLRSETTFAITQVVSGVTKPATWGVAAALVLMLILLGII